MSRFMVAGDPPRTVLATAVKGVTDSRVVFHDGTTLPLAPLGVVVENAKLPGAVLVMARMRIDGTRMTHALLPVSSWPKIIGWRAGRDGEAIPHVEGGIPAEATHLAARLGDLVFDLSTSAPAIQGGEKRWLAHLDAALRTAPKPDEQVARSARDKSTARPAVESVQPSRIAVQRNAAGIEVGRRAVPEASSLEEAMRLTGFPDPTPYKAKDVSRKVARHVATTLLAAGVDGDSVAKASAQVRQQVEDELWTLSVARSQRGGIPEAVLGGSEKIEMSALRTLAQLDEKRMVQAFSRVHAGMARQQFAVQISRGRSAAAQLQQVDEAVRSVRMGLAKLDAQLQRGESTLQGEIREAQTNLVDGVSKALATYVNKRLGAATHV